MIAAAAAPWQMTAKQATGLTQIVFELGADPVRLGLLASLKLTGGNITGIVNLSNTLLAKRIELMHDVVPNAQLIAVLLNPDDPVRNPAGGRARLLEKAVDVQIQFLLARTMSDIETAFAKVVDLRVGALVIGPDALFVAGQTKLPPWRYALAYRQLMNCANLPPPQFDGLRCESRKSLSFPLASIRPHSQGREAGRLPVPAVQKVELILNLKTAKALGITIPLPLLGRADEVVE